MHKSFFFYHVDSGKALVKVEGAQLVLNPNDHSKMNRENFFVLTLIHTRSLNH
jgi:hypothetical protein